MTTWIFQGNPDRFDMDGYRPAGQTVLRGWSISIEQEYGPGIRTGPASRNR